MDYLVFLAPKDFQAQLALQGHSVQMDLMEFLVYPENVASQVTVEGLYPEPKEMRGM